MTSKFKRAKDYVLSQLTSNNEVSLDDLSKYLSNNIGSINLYEIISQLRRIDNYIIGLTRDSKNYILLQRVDNGSYLFKDGYADKITHTNNKMSSKEAWKVFKHEDGYFYFDNQYEYKDIPLEYLSK